MKKSLIYYFIACFAIVQLICGRFSTILSKLLIDYKGFLPVAFFLFIMIGLLVLFILYVILSKKIHKAFYIVVFVISIVIFVITFILIVITCISEFKYIGSSSSYGLISGIRIMMLNYFNLFIDAGMCLLFGILAFVSKQKEK